MGKGIGLRIKPTDSADDGSSYIEPLHSSVLRHFQLTHELKSGTWIPSRVSRNCRSVGTPIRWRRDRHLYPVCSASNDPIGSTICAIDSYRRIAPSQWGHRRTLRSPFRHLLLGDIVFFPNRITQASQTINH